MRRTAVLFCAAALSLAVPARAQHATARVALAADTPGPIATIEVTAPPLIPGTLPEVLQTTPSPTPSPTSPRAVPRPVIRLFPVKATATPTPSATPAPQPTASPSPSPTPLTNVDEIPDTFPGLGTPTVGPSPLRVLIHAYPAPSRSSHEPDSMYRATPTLAPRLKPPVAPPVTVPLPVRTTLHALPVAPTAAARPLAPVAPAGTDRAYDLVGGKWTCRTFAQTPLVHRYRRDEDAISLVVDTAADVGGHSVSLVERYRYHPSTQRWSVSLADGQFIATAGRWLGQNWIFSGIDSEGGRATEATMVYKRIDAYSFVRTFTRIDPGAKNSVSGEQCLRVSQ